jgi:hypothetical protein
MNEDRRDIFKKFGMLGASALALMGVSNRAKADDRNEQQNPLLGLWDLTIPVQPAVGLPVPLLYKYAISEGGYVATGNYDTDANFNGGFTYSATMGTYARTNFPNSYRLRERSWVFFQSSNNNNPAGSTDFTGTAVVAGDGKSWSGAGTFIQYDVNGNMVAANTNFTYSATRFSPGQPAAPSGSAAVAGPRGIRLRGG